MSNILISNILIITLIIIVGIILLIVIILLLMKIFTKLGWETTDKDFIGFDEDEKENSC